MINGIRLCLELLLEVHGEVLLLVKSHGRVGVQYILDIVVILKQSGKCAVGFVLFGIVMDYVINSFQQKAAWTRHFTPPAVISSLS